MTTISRLHERAQRAFHTALVAREATGKWDRGLADRYIAAEADLRWEEADVARREAMDYTESEARAMDGNR